MLKRTVPLFILVLLFLSACNERIFESVKPVETKTKNEAITKTNSVYPGVEIESKIVENEDFRYAVHYPVFNSERIDLEITKIMEEKIKSFIEIVSKLEKNDGWPYHFYSDYKITYFTNEHISIVFTESSFLGQEETEDRTFTLNFSREDGKRLILEDIFTNEEEYLYHLSQASYEQLLNNKSLEGKLHLEWVKIGTKPIRSNFRQFSITPKELKIYFQENQVGSNHIGSQTISISWEELKHIIKEDFIVSLNNNKQIRADDNNEEEEVNETNDKVDQNDNSSEVGNAEVKKRIAFTFDDGPHGTVTGQILEHLKQYNAKATFFVLGNRVGYYPELLLQMQASGHEIGNHTWDHKQLTLLGEESIRHQLQKTSDTIYSVTGQAPTLMRPPYGSTNVLLSEVISESVVLWSIDTLDWRNRNSGSIVNEVMENVEDGAIVLMHDIHESTAEAVLILLEELSNEGYEFVTVSELLNFGEVEPVSGQVYYKK